MIVLFALPEENGYKERHVLIHENQIHWKRKRKRVVISRFCRSRYDDSDPDCLNHWHFLFLVLEYDKFNFTLYGYGWGMPIYQSLETHNWLEVLGRCMCYLCMPEILLFFQIAWGQSLARNKISMFKICQWL